MKKGLVLEGGAMRGMFTAGILDVFMKNGITFDGIAAVSAGAAFGCNYKSGQAGRALRYNIKYCRDPRYCSFRSLIKTGNIFGADFCYRLIPEKLDIFDTKAYNENPMEFHVVCTDLETGKAVYRNCQRAEDDYIEWIRASASMPMVSRPVKVGGYTLLDGGIADSIPLKYFESIGYNKNVVILTRHNGYEKKKNRMMPFLRARFREYPNFVEALAKRHIIYNETLKYISEKEKSGEILVIRPPDSLDIGRIEHHPEKLYKIYSIGKQTAEKQLDSIKASPRKTL